MESEHTITMHRRLAEELFRLIMKEVRVRAPYRIPEVKELQELLGIPDDEVNRWVGL